MGKRINKEKAQAYIREYTTNGFNKTKAIQKVSNYMGKGANKQATRDHERLVRVGEFDLSSINEAWIIDKIQHLALKAKKESDRLRALELLGKFRALFTDKIQQTGDFLPPPIYYNTIITTKPAEKTTKPDTSRIKQ